MDLNKNKYLFREEVVRIINNIPDKYSVVRTIILEVYDKGVPFGLSVQEHKPLYSIRTIQRCLKKASNNMVGFADLRRTYLLNNPTELIKKKPCRRGRTISASLRWKILCRDGFKCVACGVSSKQEVLHIDHWWPLSLGGTTDEKNLRSLCGLCNMGKGTLLLEFGIREKQRLHGN